MRVEGSGTAGGGGGGGGCDPVPKLPVAVAPFGNVWIKSTAKLDPKLLTDKPELLKRVKVQLLMPELLGPPVRL